MDTDDRKLSKKIKQTKALYERHMSGDKLNPEEYHKCLKYSKYIVNTNVIEEQNTKIKELSNRVNQLQQNIKATKKERKAIREEKKGFEQCKKVCDKLHENNKKLELQLIDQQKEYSIMEETIQTSREIYIGLMEKQREEILTLKDQNNTLKDQNIKYLRIATRQNTSTLVKEWKKCCHKLMSLIKEIKKLNDSDTVQDLCSYVEYIDFPEEITRRSMIESGIAYNPSEDTGGFTDIGGFTHYEWPGPSIGGVDDY